MACSWNKKLRNLTTVMNYDLKIDVNLIWFKKNDAWFVDNNVLRKLWFNMEIKIKLTLRK